MASDLSELILEGITILSGCTNDLEQNFAKFWSNIPDNQKDIVFEGILKGSSYSEKEVNELCH